MKTIKEKAERYNEALNKAKEYKKHGYMMINAVLDNIFPELAKSELAESEDERIKKALIMFFQRFPYDSIENAGTNAKEAIAWLEKQGKSQVRTGIEWLNAIDDACDKRYSEGYAEGEYCHEQSFKWGFQEGVEWFEKQGELKETICDKCKKEQPSHSCQDITALGRCALEKQYEATYQIRKDIATFILNYEGDIKDRNKWINYLV